MHLVYLAGPFFNAAQLEHIGIVESMLEELEISFYSARLKNLCPPDAPSEKRKEVFKDNVDGIRIASVVIALMDWLMPPNQSVFICGQRLDRAWVPHPPALNVPDSGTVFELGVAHTLNVPVIGFWKDKPTRPVNLMLQETTAGTIYGYEALSRFLSDLVLARYDVAMCVKELRRHDVKEIE